MVVWEGEIVTGYERERERERKRRIPQFNFLFKLGNIVSENYWESLFLWLQMLLFCSGIFLETANQVYIKVQTLVCKLRKDLFDHIWQIRTSWAAISSLVVHICCPYLYPQLIQLQSNSRQRRLYFKGHLGLKNCFITEICSWHFWLKLQEGPSVTPLIWIIL